MSKKLAHNIRPDLKGVKKGSPPRLAFETYTWQYFSMRIGAFEISEPVPELQKPHALTMVRPWVDVGSVGTLTLRRLERHFGAKELGRLARPGTFFDFTRYRPTIRTVDGQRQVTVPNTIVNYAQPESGPEFLFLHLLEPHAMGEDYTDSVVELFKYFGVSRYCRLGAMYDAVPHTRPLLVTGTVGSVVAREGRTIPIRTRRGQYQGPTTILNVISDSASEMGIESMNFMAHLPQYLQLEEDYSGTARMLDVLSSIYDIPDDLAPSQRGDRQYRELTSAAEKNSELKTLISQLESYYDSQYLTESTGEEGPPAPLSPEIERFLKDLDQNLEGPQS